MILADMWGYKGKPLTNQDIADLTATRLSAKGQEGVSLYLAELKKKFGVDRYARYGLTTGTPTPAKLSPTPAGTAAPAATATRIPTATPDLRGTWTRISRTESALGNNLGYTNAIFSNASVTVVAGYSNDDSAKWTCAWPDPPASLAAGQSWTGNVTLQDAGSKYSSVARASIIFIGEYGYNGSLGKGAQIVTNVPPKASDDIANGTFKWVMPGLNSVSYGTQLVVTADCQLGHGTGVSGKVLYKYEFQK